MLEQQSRLLVEECHLLQRELDRCRKNLAKLIDMHNVVSTERDRLRADLAKTTTRLSDCFRESSMLENRLAGLEKCREQLQAIHEADRLRLTSTRKHP